jgi:hypothetical protein
MGGLGLPGGQCVTAQNDTVFHRRDRDRTGDMYDSWFMHVDRHGGVRALDEYGTEHRGWDALLSRIVRTTSSPASSCRNRPVRCSVWVT